MKLDQAQKQNTSLERAKQKLLSGPTVRLVHQSITKCHRFENRSFYNVLLGKACSYCPFTIQNLIKILTLKMTALHNTLVDDSENSVHLLILLCSYNWRVMFVFDQTSVERLYCDKVYSCGSHSKYHDHIYSYGTAFKVLSHKAASRLV